MRSRCCLRVCESPPPINFWMPEQMCMKLGTYIMAAVCLCVYPRVAARQRLGKHFPAATNILNKK
jgi:hypothetical protein